MIHPETIDKIMDATRIEEVVGEFVNLKKRGVNLIGLCPFHNEKTPSFTVSPPKGIYKCFGCGKGGNAVNFLMDQEHFSYPEALKYLAAKYNIEVEEEKPTPEQQQALDEKESLFNLNAFAQKYFQEQLHQNEEGKAIGLSYLKERGFSLEVIQKFGLGYCLNKWDEFSRHAQKNGYKKEYLVKTSLSKSKDQQLYDTFRGRIMFPIHNLSGRVLGFGGRIMTSEKNKPKYINSAESEIYHKSKALYGLFFAKSAVASSDNCYLVEGYTDVISLFQAGIENVIATSGTALSTDQIRLIRRYTSNVTLLFDGDAAGLKAAFRGIDLILEEGLNVRVVIFPEGEDPDSFAQSKRPLEVKEFIESNARDFISLKTDLLLEETSNDPIKKAGLIKEIAQTISLIPDPIARTLYVQKCSDTMQVDEKLLFAEINKMRRKNFQQKRKQTHAETDEHAWVNAEEGIAEKQTPLPLEENFQEIEIIRILLKYGSEELTLEVENEDKRMEEIIVRVMDFIVDDLEEDKITFENEACREIFTYFLTARQNQSLPDEQVFFQHESENIRKLAIDLLTTPYSLSDNWEERHRIYVKKENENLRENVYRVLYAFKLKKLEKMIGENQEKIKKADNDEELMPLLENERNLKNTRSRFAKELDRVVTK